MKRLSEKNSPARILYCSHTAALMGSAISLYHLMTGLDRNKYTPVAAFSKDGPLVSKLNSEGIKSVVLKKRGFLNLGLIRESMRLFKDEKVDLVHLNSAVPFCKNIGLAAMIAGVPVIWHIREDPEGKRVKDLKKWIRLFADKIVVISSDLEEFFRDTGKVIMVWNGVDTEKFKPENDGNRFREKFGIPPGAFVFSIIGTIEPRKGTLNFINAAKDMSLAREDVYFTVVGKSFPDELEKAKEIINNDPRLSERVILTGSLDNIPEVMAGTDVVVIPSLWEGFPSRVLIESLASGTPVIVSDIGAAKEITGHGEAGFTVPKGDVKALKDAMEKCLKMDGEALAKMGRTARIKSGSFTISKHVETVQNIYGTLFSEK